MSLERLQKILAQAGLASRRAAEEWIAEGLVTVNGKVAKLGDKAEAGKDAIKVKGKLLTRPENLAYIAFHKPKGVISMMTDPQDRPNLSHYFNSLKVRVFPVGRLDFNSEGLILLTNDGDFAEKVQKSLSMVRVYSVKVKGHPDSEMLSRLQRGMKSNDRQHRSFKPHSIQVKQKLLNKTVIQVVLTGSGAFNLKALFDDRGFLVEKVVRTSIGHLTLKSLAPGEYRHLKQSQVYALLEQPELGMKRLDFENSKRRPDPSESSEKRIKIKPLPQTGPRSTKTIKR